MKCTCGYRWHCGQNVQSYPVTCSQVNIKLLVCAAAVVWFEWLWRWTCGLSTSFFSFKYTMSKILITVLVIFKSWYIDWSPESWPSVARYCYLNINSLRHWTLSRWSNFIWSILPKGSECTLFVSLLPWMEQICVIVSTCIANCCVTGCHSVCF